MNPLLTILRAAHCRSTHHYFAIDALPLVQTSSGKRLASWLLRYHDRYLTGAKDPDTRFRDFHNHVIHVADGYWGGAPRAAQQWYDRMQRYLRDGRYGDAAHAAGVISHYFTDPIQPLHTGQTSVEKVLHRPIEWSITKSYHEIYQRWQDDDSRVVFQLSEGPGWLGEAILHGARFAHRHYDDLVGGYRLDLGVKDPPAGLDDHSRQILADLFGVAISGWARVLERIALESELANGSSLPSASISMTSLLASIRIPTRYWMKRISSITEQAAVQKLVDEFSRTGNVVENLPAEVDVVQRVVKVHHDELRWKEARLKKVNQSETVVAINLSEERQEEKGHSENINAADQQQEFPQGQLDRPEEQKETNGDHKRETLPFVAFAQGTDAVRTGAQEVKKKPSLLRSDRLVDAPSIGPKTAARFKAIGIETVGQFLNQTADAMAKQLGTRWITSDTLRHWQAQTTLMCEMPKMLAREVQLLVGAGYRTTEQINQDPPEQINQSIARFALTSSGKRYLRGAEPPSLERIAEWTKGATETEKSNKPVVKQRFAA